MLCVSTFGMFYALGFVPLATAAAISFTAPLIVTALAPFALGERVGAARAIAVGVGFLGAMEVVRPGSGAYHWAVFLIFISAAASAVTQVLSRKVAGHDAPETSNTYMVLAGFILASLPLAFRVAHACKWAGCAGVVQPRHLRRAWALLPGQGFRTRAGPVCIAVQLRSDPRGCRAQLCSVRASARPLDLDRERYHRFQWRLYLAERKVARSALGGPHRAIAVGDLALHRRRGAERARSRCSSTRPRPGQSRKIRSWSRARPILACSARVRSQPARGGQDRRQPALQSSALGGQRRGGQVGDALGQGEHGLAARACRRKGTGSSLASTRVGDVAGQMRQAGLLRVRVALLGRVAVRDPHRGPVPVHHGPHHAWRPASARPDGPRPPRERNTQ